MELKEKVQLIKSGKLKALDNLLSFSKKIAEPKTKDLNIFLSLNENAIEQAKQLDKRIEKGGQVGKLAGLCFAVKSNISVQGFETNCASKVLEGYVSPYNASVINSLLAEDAIFIGMVNMDEFACGTSGETSAFGPTKNPKNPELIPGGSSSGSAAAVSAGLCDFALGSDTGGSIRNPASHCGVYGLKPTYGAVSRYGLIDLSMSLDVIGVLANSAQDAFFVFDVIKGQDYFDTTTNSFKQEEREIKTIGVVDVKDYCDPEINQIIKSKINETAKKFNLKTKEVKLPLNIVLATYYLIVYTEFFSATRKFDGRRFGKKIENAAGKEVLRRIFGGSEISKAEHLGRFYNKALKARNFIKKEFERIFKEVDIIALPTVPKFAHKIGENLSVKEMYSYDVLTTPASLAGLPAISCPIKYEKEIGLQLIAPQFNEKTLSKAAELFSN